MALAEALGYTHLAVPAMKKHTDMARWMEAIVPVLFKHWSSTRHTSVRDIPEEMVEDLRGRKRFEFCRACRDERDEIVTAEFIIWGKLTDPQHLGPRCYDHTEQVVGRDMYRIDQWAIFDLRPFNRLLGSVTQKGGDTND